MCVLCGAVNRSTITGKTFKLRCSERSCRARYVFGEVFYLMPGGGHIAPPMDRIIPGDSRPVDSFPAATLADEPYRNWGTVNRLVLSEP